MFIRLGPESVQPKYHDAAHFRFTCSVTCLAPAGVWMKSCALKT